MKLRLLSAAEVRSAMPMAEAIRAVRQAFVELSAGRATMPVRVRVDVPRRSGISLYMPGYLAGSHQLATKIVAIFPENLTRTPPLPPSTRWWWCLTPTPVCLREPCTAAF